MIGRIEGLCNLGIHADLHVPLGFDLCVAFVALLIDEVGQWLAHHLVEYVHDPLFGKFLEFFLNGEITLDVLSLSIGEGEDLLQGQGFVGGTVDVLNLGTVEGYNMKIREGSVYLPLFSPEIRSLRK